MPRVLSIKFWVNVQVLHLTKPKLLPTLACPSQAKASQASVLFRQTITTIKQVCL